MTFVLSAVGFVLLLTVLVIAHELGHFCVARWRKVTVEEFGFGLPPRAKSLFHWKGTLFSLNWIPFGGFVRLQGENSLDPNERERLGSFAAASIPSRLAILCAGVFMNFLIAIVIFSLGFWLWQWVPTYLSLDALRAAEAQNEVSVEWSLYVVEATEGGNAAAAGITADTLLTSVNGTPVSTVDDVIALQKNQSSVTYMLLTGEEFTNEESFSVSVDDGKTGVALSAFAKDVVGQKRSLVDGVRIAFRESWVVVVGTLKGISSLFTKLLFEQRVPDDIAGIVGIAQLTHHSLQEGVMVYIRLVALLSLSLAVLNILPFPALDGGRTMFVLFEGLSGKPVNRRFEVMINGLGIIFLLLLMAVVTFNDVLRIVSS